MSQYKLGDEIYGKLGETLAPKTVGHVHRFLHRALGTALKWDPVARSVCDLVEQPKVPHHEISPLDAPQTRAFLAAAKGDRLEALYVLALTSGMRQGELLGLKWSDIDFASGTLQVKRGLARILGKGLLEQEPKTAKSRRSIKLTELATRALQRHRTDQLQARLLAGSEWEDHNYLFTTALGRPLEQSHLVKRSFKPILVRAGLPAIQFHDLRHSAATLLFALGTDVKTMQELLGHSRVSTTFDIHTHRVPSLHVDAAYELDALLTG